MNYIELINSFWYKSRQDELKGNDIAVYFAILDYCNRLNWQNPFICHWDIICQTAGVSKNTYYKSVEKLDSLKYIKYSKGKRNVSGGKIVVLKLENNKGTIKEQQGNRKGIEKEQQGNLIKPINNKLINKETKETTKVAPPPSFNFDEYLNQVNKLFDRSFKKLNPAVKAKMKATLKTYDNVNIWNAMINCKNDQYHIETNYKYCTPEFFSRASTIDKHGDKILKPKKREYSDDEMIYPD